MSYRLDDPQSWDERWLGDQDSNLDSQIQSLMSYQLDDPQKAKSPGRRLPTGAFGQKADPRLPSAL